MMAAGDLYGWDKRFPVLVIKPYDQELEDRWKLIEKAEDYRSHGFKDCCDWAAHRISKWNKPAPDNFIELYRGAIFKIFNESIEHVIDHIDIDFDIELEETDRYPKVKVYLTKYGDYELEDKYNPYETWLEDMYDMSGEYEDYPEVTDSDLLI